jgi:hypothetical protein
MRAAGALAAGLALIAPASAEAAGWSRAATLSPRNAGLTTPAVAVNGAGEGVIAAGGGLPASPAKVRAALVKGRRFGRPRALGRGRDVVAAIGPDGTAVTAWTGRGDALKVAVRRPGGRFGAARTLAGYGAQPRVAVAATGEVAVTWLEYHRDFVRAKAAFGTAGGFGAPVPLDTASFAYPVELAFAGSGDLAMAWSAQSVPGSGPTWTVKAIHREPGGSLGAVQEPASGYAYDVRVARSTTGGTYLSWIGNSGPEEGTLGPTQTAIAPAGGGFDAPASPEPKNARTLGAQVTAVGDSLLTIYTMRKGPLRAAVRTTGAGFRTLTVLTQSAAQNPELDGSLATWSQPRIQLARRLPGGRWTRVKPPRGVPAQKRGSDAVHATAAEGRRVIVAWLDWRGRVRAAARTL